MVPELTCPLLALSVRFPPIWVISPLLKNCEGPPMLPKPVMEPLLMEVLVKSMVAPLMLIWPLLVRPAVVRKRPLSSVMSAKLVMPTPTERNVLLMITVPWLVRLPLPSC